MIEYDKIRELLALMLPEVRRQAEAENPQVTALPDEPTMADIMAMIAGGPPNAALISLHMVELGVKMAREKAECREFTFKDALRDLMKERKMEEAYADLLVDAKFIQVIDEDGDRFHQSVLIYGERLEPGQGDEPNMTTPEFLEIVVEAMEAIRPQLSDEEWAAAVDIARAGASDDTPIEKEFTGTVTRVAERTEEEVSKFRSEIDDLFETWEGGN